MNRLIILICTIAAIAPQTFADLAARSNLGLFGGQVEALATFDIASGSNRVYADLRGPNALYYSDVDAATWIESITAQETRGVVTDATFVYSIVNDTIWRSAGDDGRNWTEVLNATTSVYQGEAFHSIQHDGHRLMIGAASAVVYSSTDGDPAGWSRYAITSATEDDAVVAITSVPGMASTLFAVVQNVVKPASASNQIFKSTDSGTTWAAVTLPGSVTQPIQEIGIDPNNTDHIYLAGSSAQATIYLSTDGLTSSLKNITPASFASRFPQYIEFSNGLTWTTAHTYDPSTATWTAFPKTTNGTNLNDGAIAFDPDNASEVYTTSDVGVARSLDNGATWTEANNGLLGVQVNDVDVDLVAGSKNYALVATKSGVALTSVFQKPPTPADWTFPVFPQGTGGAPLTAAAFIWGTTNEMIVGENSENIYTSTDGGSTWTKTFTWSGSPIKDRSSVNDIDSAASSNVVYAGLGFWENGTDGVVVRSDDRGATWTETALTGVHVNALEVVGATLVYAAVGNQKDVSNASNQGIYGSVDSGSNWTQLTFGGSAIDGIVSDLAQDPVNPLFQYATITGGASNGLYQIEYATSGLNIAAMTNVTTAFGGPTGKNLTAVETNDTGTKVFAAFDQDIYEFNTTSNTWTLFSSGLNGEEIFVLFWDELVSGNSTGFYAHTEIAQATDDEPTATPTPTATFTQTPTPLPTPTNTPRPGNSAPVITFSPEIPASIIVGTIFTTQLFVTDADGDAVTLSLSSGAPAEILNVVQAGGNVSARLEISSATIAQVSFSLFAYDGSDATVRNIAVDAAEPTPTPTETFTPTPTPTPTPVVLADIVDTATSVETFSTLVAAIEAANLVEVLKGEGPFTVFAPTNDAFNALPEGTLESLLLPENQAELANILLYHVLPGQFNSSAVSQLSSAETATTNQQLVTFSQTDTGIQINGANIIDPDIEASNGIIHAIDTVLIPENLPNIVDVATNAGTFTTLVAALQLTALDETLSGTGPFTVFAPSDDAFQALPEGLLEALLLEENLEVLTQILTYHVVADQVISSEVASATELATVNGDPLTVTVGGESIQIDQSNITSVDIDASNGVIHVIDNVLIPSNVDVQPLIPTPTPTPTLTPTPVPGLPLPFTEDFEGLTLGDSVEEEVSATGVWTNTPPDGWSIDNLGVVGADTGLGVDEWIGWSFANKDWWVQTAGDQRRSEFVNGIGTVAIADPDEWDDIDSPGDLGTFNSFLTTPPISLVGVEANTVNLTFDSSWRDEDTQSANITVSYDGTSPVEVLRWSSDPSSPDFHDDFPNETVTVALNNPAGASTMVVNWGMLNATNDWWWAIDNVVIESQVPTPPTPTPTVTPVPGETPGEVPAVDEIVLGQGQGGRNRVQIRNFDPNSPFRLNQVITGFPVVPDPFLNAIGGGRGRTTYFSIGDLDGDSKTDIVFSFGTVLENANFPNIVIPFNMFERRPIGRTFNAFPAGTGDPVRFSGGEIRTAIGDFLADGQNLIATAQGASSERGLVRIWELNTDENRWRPVVQFQPLDNTPANNNANGGVTLAAGDVDNDGLDELLAGQTNSETSLTQFTVIDVDADGNHVRRNFVGFPAGFRGRGGIEVVVADLDGNGTNEIVVTSKSVIEGQPGNLISVIVPVIEGGVVTGFVRPANSVQQLIGDISLNPGGALNVGKGEFDGDSSNGDEIIIGSGAGAPQSFYRILKLTYDPNQGENGAITDLSYLIGPPKNLDFILPAFLNQFNPSSGEVFVDGAAFIDANLQ